MSLHEATRDNPPGLPKAARRPRATTLVAGRFHVRNHGRRGADAEHRLDQRQEKAIVNLKKAKALTPEAIVKAPHRQLAGWLKPSGYFNIKAKRLKAMCRWLVEQGGVRKLAAEISTHDLRTALIAVYGIGPETADDIVLYAFNRPVFVIDAYTRRVFSRLGLIKGEEGYETLRHLFENKLKPDVALFNEYHALIVKHGKDICRARPWCTACCLRPVCPSGG